MVEIDYEENNNSVHSNRKELQLFPMGDLSSSPMADRAKFWSNLSAPEAYGGGGTEMGILNAQLPPANQVQQIPAKKGRRGPRSRSSQYRGVTFYRRTGRWESHIWSVYKYIHTHIHRLI